MSVRIDDLSGAELPEDSLEDMVGGRGRMMGPNCLWVSSALGGGAGDPLDVKIQ